MGNNDGKSSLEWLKKLIKQLIKIKTFNIDITVKPNTYLSIITPIKGGLKEKEIIKKIYQRLCFLQNISNCEFLFVLDGAKKNKVSKIKKTFFLKDNLKIFGYKQNKGPGFARNIGIKRCNGEKIIFLDFDDLIIIKNLKKLISFSRKERFLIACNYKINYPGKGKSTDNFKKNLNFYKSKGKLNYLINKSINREVIYYLFDKKMLINKKIFLIKFFLKIFFFLLNFSFIIKKK